MIIDRTENRDLRLLITVSEYRNKTLLTAFNCLSDDEAVNIINGLRRRQRELSPFVSNNYFIRIDLSRVEKPSYFNDYEKDKTFIKTVFSSKVEEEEISEIPDIVQRIIKKVKNNFHYCFNPYPVYNFENWKGLI